MTCKEQAKIGFKFTDVSGNKKEEEQFWVMFCPICKKVFPICEELPEDHKLENGHFKVKFEGNPK